MLTKGILIEKYLSSFSKYHIYLLPRPKPPKFLHIPICKNCPLSWRSKRAFPSGEMLIFPASRASRYNTLHFASKVVRQRGTLWNPFLPNHRQKISRNIFQKGETCFLLFCYGRYCITHSKRSNLLQLYVQSICLCRIFLRQHAPLTLFLLCTPLILQDVPFVHRSLSC